MAKKAQSIDFDPYNILQLSADCEEWHIDKAYKKCALRWHPDKNPENKEQAQEMFLKIYQSYEFLKDKLSRTEYDRRVALKRRRAEFEESRQATSSAQRKAFLNKLNDKEAAAEKAASQNRYERGQKDDLINQLRKEGAEMLRRMKENVKRPQKVSSESEGQSQSIPRSCSTAADQSTDVLVVDDDLLELEKAVFGDLF